MAAPVHVTSIDALEAFRSSLIIFMNKAHQCADEVGDDVRRTRMWLQSEQRQHCEHELRKSQRVLEQAQAELMSARLQQHREAIAVREIAVMKARRVVAEAEGKLRHVKRWSRDFDSVTDPLVRQLEGIRQVLDHDLPKALAFLVQAQKTLDAYTTLAPPAAPQPEVRS